MPDVLGSLVERAIGATIGPRPRTLSRFEPPPGAAVEPVAARPDSRDPTGGGGDDVLPLEHPPADASLRTILRTAQRDPSGPVRVDAQPLDAVHRAEPAERLDESPHPLPINGPSRGLARTPVPSLGSIRRLGRPIGQEALEPTADQPSAPADRGRRPAADAAPPAFHAVHAAIAAETAEEAVGKPPVRPASAPSRPRLEPPSPSPGRAASWPGHPSDPEMRVPEPPSGGAPSVAPAIAHAVAPRRSVDLALTRPSAGETAVQAEPPGRPLAMPSSGDGARTIHVSIGRIEVRAVTPAPGRPPRAQPPTRDTAPSLEDYLRVRNGPPR